MCIGENISILAWSVGKIVFFVKYTLLRPPRAQTVERDNVGSSGAGGPSSSNVTSPQSAGRGWAQQGGRFGLPIGLGFAGGLGQATTSNETNQEEVDSNHEAITNTTRNTFKDFENHLQNLRDEFYLKSLGDLIVEAMDPFGGGSVVGDVSSGMGTLSTMLFS